MKINYALTLSKFFLIAGILLISIPSSAQESKIFRVSDFDLKGKVRSCLVITDYGKEEFEFNEAGYLTKSVTRYSDKDYNITYYIFKGTHLNEIRNENYRDGTFDKNTSIAHFYRRDSLEGIKITEQIISYNKEILDLNEYYYNDDNTLQKVTRSNNEGVDETTLEYSNYKGETTTSYFLNEVLLKSIRTSIKKKRDGTNDSIVLTKEFLDGIPNKAVEETYDHTGNLISQTKFEYSVAEKSFVPLTVVTYKYDEEGMLSSITTKQGERTETKTYIFQFDGEGHGNWVKQIISPDNSYITRKITYYKEDTLK